MTDRLYVVVVGLVWALAFLAVPVLLSLLGGYA
jgi:hypothetical protein